ncbi:MAG: ATP-binding protein [Actinobacteria bacterium]|nr:ATP-binding protein [Actinomycetota bacterium]MBW3648279.1 ATP-binding protein [Actinomycetota bacterium]
MEPRRNPYAPGAGQRPPELAGRETEIEAFGVALDRLSGGRSARGLMLSGLRGVGKTVLLNELRSQAIDSGWATGKLEARFEQGLRRPLATALFTATRELSVRRRAGDRVRSFWSVLKAFSLTSEPHGGWTVGLDVEAARGRADSGDLEIDLVELFADAAELGADHDTGIALFLDEMQDAPVKDLSAVCAAVHDVSQVGSPLLVVGAGLPHLPSVLTAAKSYAERLFTYRTVDRLDPMAAALALTAPAAREGVGFTAEGLAALLRAADGYPYFLQAYGSAAWDAAPLDPIGLDDVEAGRREADAELATGFFGSRWERATPAERAYLLAMAELLGGRDGAVPTAAVATHLGRRAASLSPARDTLRRKGLIYSEQRGTVAFTVPHFARFASSRTD